MLVRIRAALTVVLVLALMAASCTRGDDPEEAVVRDPVDEGAERVGDEVRYAQDLLIYDRIATIDHVGQTIDLTDAVTAAVSGAPQTSIELIDGVVFEIYDLFDGTLLGPEGEPRDDVEVVVGFIENEDGRSLAVLATPELGATAPIGTEDQISIDLTFLGEVLAPGDPLVVDHAFLQGLPLEGSDEPADLSGPELLTLRMAEQRVAYLGEIVDGEPQAQVYTAQMGVVVSGSNRGTLPAKAQPMHDGFKKGVKGCRGGLRCVFQFFNKFGGGAAGSNDLLVCNLGPCNGPPPRDPPVCRGFCGSGRGEPHLRTFDGTRYGMQGVGEFVAARTDGLEVQMRTAPFGSSRRVSVITAVAMHAGGHTVIVDVGAEDRILLDGEPFSDRAGRQLGDVDLTVQQRGKILQMQTADDQMVSVVMYARSLSVYVSPDDDTGVWEGLFGDLDGDTSNDLQTRDGIVLERPYGFDELYGEFVDSWRISDAESLFVYAAGENTSTFTDRGFPEGPATLDMLPEADRTRASAVCIAAGILDLEVLDTCVLDYALTGDMDMVRAAQTDDTVELVLSGRLAPDGSERDDDETEAAPGARDGLSWLYELPDRELVDARGQEPLVAGQLVLLRTLDANGRSWLTAVEHGVSQVRWELADISLDCRPTVTPGGRIVALLAEGAEHSLAVEGAELVELDPHDGTIVARWAGIDGQGLSPCALGLSADDDLVIHMDGAHQRAGRTVTALAFEGDLAPRWSATIAPGSLGIARISAPGIHVLREDGEVVVLERLARDTGEVISRLDLPGNGVSKQTPGVLQPVGDDLYAVLTRAPRTELPTLSIIRDAGDLELAWTYAFGADEELSAQPKVLAPVGDVVVGWANPAGRDGIAAFGAAKGEIRWKANTSGFSDTVQILGSAGDEVVATTTFGRAWLEVYDINGAEVATLDAVSGLRRPSGIGGTPEGQVLLVGDRGDGGIYVATLDPSR